ncbi:MAG: hypothetical protein AAB327_01395 [Actinomycetota bacterium]
MGSTPTSGTTDGYCIDALRHPYTKHSVASTGSFMNSAGTISSRLIERRLVRGSLTLRRLREELRVVDEHLVMLTEDAQDKEIRSLVAETPNASFEHRDAQAHVDSLSHHRVHLLNEIAELESRQDSLLDKLGR